MPDNPQIPDYDPKELPQAPGLFELTKTVQGNLHKAVANTYDPYRQMKSEGFNAAPTQYGGTNFQRYYGRNAYKSLGFNPYIDNEKYYNANTDAWDDFNEARRQWGGLFGLGFSSLWSGRTDEEEARDYERYSNIGSSTRGGFAGTFTNAFLNSGYTIGLLSEIALEEVGLAALEIVSYGSATPIVAARTGANAARLARGVGTIARLTNRSTSTLKRLKDLRNIGKAKSFWNGAKNLGNAVNPLRGTTEFLGTFGRQYQRSVKTGKIERLGAAAKFTKGFGTFYRDIREINLALDEAHLEKGFVENRTREGLIKEFIDKNGRHPNEKEMESIKETARTGGQNTLFQNSWLIYATNRVAFGNYFNKWLPRSLGSTGRKIAGGRFVKNFRTGKLDFIKHGGVLGYKTFVNEAKHAFKKSTLKRLPWQTAKFLGKYTRVNFGEGMQEYFQEVIQDAEFEMARDRYYAGLSGGLWYDSMFSDDYMDQYGESLKKYVSHEGAEVFASGFLMGIFAGPFSRGSQYVTKQLTDKGKYVFNKDGYAAEKKQIKDRQAELEEKVKKFNEMTDERKGFLKDFINYTVRQTDRKNKQQEAQEEDDQKTFIDMKDEALVDQILFAESMGAFDLVIEKLKDMSKLSEEDLRNAFGEQVDEESTFISDFKGSYNKVIERADSIHQMSQHFDKLFPPPPEYGLENSDLETGMQQRDVKRAWQRAKYTAILYQQSLVRTMERMDSISKDLYGKKAPWYRKDKTPPSSDVTRAFDQESISQELSLLKEEIRNLEDFDKLDPQQKKDLQYKKNLVENLNALTEAIETYQGASLKKAAIEFEVSRRKEAADLSEGKPVRYRRGQTKWEGVIVGETTDKKGREQWIIERADGKTTKILKESTGIVREEIPDVAYDEMMAGPEDVLRNAFKSYLELIGEKSGNTLDESKIDDAFASYKDFFALKQDNLNLSKTVSLLLDPKGHAAFVERYNAMIQAERESDEEVLRDQLNAFLEATEVNDLVKMLTGSYNAFILEDDLAALVEDNIIPDVFYDTDTVTPIRNDSDRHKNIVEAIKNWQIETERVEAPTEEAPAKEEAKKADIEKELFTAPISLNNWTSVEHGKYIELLTLRGDLEKRDLLRNLDPKYSWQLYAVENLSEEEAGNILSNIKEAKGPITSDTPWAEWPEELKREAEEQLRKYNQLMDETPGGKQFPGDVEEFIKPGRPGQFKMAPILKEYNANKAIEETVEEKLKQETAPVTPRPAAEPPKAKEEEELEAPETMVKGETVPEGVGEVTAEGSFKIHPEATIPLGKEEFAAIVNGRATGVTVALPKSRTQAVITAWVKAGVLPADRSLDTDHAGLSFTMEGTNTAGQKIQVVFTYMGRQTLEEAGGFYAAVEQLGLPTEGTEEFAYPVTFEKDTYYAANESQQLWLEGQGKQHVFNTNVRLAPVEMVAESVEIDQWKAEIQKSFDDAKLQKDLEDALTIAVEKNMDREDEGLASLFDEDIQAMYEEAKKNLINKLDVTDFEVGEHYEMKGKLRKFGDSIVSKVSPEGVVFKSVKTGETSDPIKKKDLAKVVKEKITDMSEAAAAATIEMTPEEEKLNETNKKNVEEFSKDSGSIGEVLDKADTMSDEEADKDFLDNLGCD